jgi:hypothetical protein
MDTSYRYLQQICGHVAPTCDQLSAAEKINKLPSVKMYPEILRFNATELVMQFNLFFFSVLSEYTPQQLFTRCDVCCMYTADKLVFRFC